MGQRYFGNKHGGNKNAFYPQEYPSTWTLITQDEVTFEAKNKSMKKRHLNSSCQIQPWIKQSTFILTSSVVTSRSWPFGICQFRFRRSKEALMGFLMQSSNTSTGFTTNIPQCCDVFGWMQPTWYRIFFQNGIEQLDMIVMNLRDGLLPWPNWL